MKQRFIYLLLYILGALLLSPWAKAQKAEPTDSLEGGFIERLADSSAPDTLAAQRNLELAELAYQRKDYAEALRQYEHVFLTYPTARTYYNMALCYTHMEQIAQAILHYEKALLLEPTMQEARHNLRLLYAQTQDGLSDGRALTALDNLCYALPISTLSYMALGLFVLLVSGFLLFRLSPDVRVRRLGFYTALVLALLWFVVLAMMLHQRYYQGIAQRRAIVVVRQELKPTPTGQGNSILTLHEGTAVLLEAKPLGHWQEVSLGDGRKGWLPLESFSPVSSQTMSITP